MLVRQIYLDNSLRNYNYLIACPDSGEAMAIDPLNAKLCLDAATAEGWRITQILNTHEHHDHIGGNDELRAATGANILAHHRAADKIPGMARGLKAGDVVKIGRRVELEVLDTPGHTMSHVCLLAHVDQPALFAGDTMFAAGVGNCKGGGHPQALYETFANQIFNLGDDVRLYPGHDYIANNLKFTLSREPGNERAAAMLAGMDGRDVHAEFFTTLGQERAVNSFFRLASPGVIARLKAEIPGFGDNPTPRDVFLALRELRNHW